MTTTATMRETATAFLQACDGGEGWAACKPYCHEGAAFTVQAPALDGIDTVEAYAEWAASLASPIPDNACEVRALAVDEERDCVLAYCVFRGTHDGDGGPVPPTGKRTESDYVYALHFADGRIDRMTKIWNDGYALGQLGWA